MFNFRKKTAGTKVIDRLTMSVAEKWKALAELIRADPAYVVIFWFDESQAAAETFFKENNVQVDCLPAREAGLHHITNQKIFFGEHYPLYSKEEELYQKLGLEQAIVFSSVTEPLIARFGGGNVIQQFMQKMGLTDGSVIEHPMISGAIHRAQDKIRKKLLIENLSTSQEDWFKKNLPP